MTNALHSSKLLKIRLKVQQYKYQPLRECSRIFQKITVY